MRGAETGVASIDSCLDWLVLHVARLVLPPWAQVLLLHFLI